MKYLYKLLLIGLLSVVLSGCQVETVSQHNAKIESEAASRKEQLSENTLETGQEPSGEDAASSLQGTSPNKKETSSSKTDGSESAIHTTSTFESKEVTQSATTKKQAGDTVTEKVTKKKKPISSKPATQQTTTKPVNKETTTTKPQQQWISVTLSITCQKVLGHPKLNTSSDVPADGFIIKSTAVVLKPGENAFLALQYACQEKGIPLDYQYTPMFNSYYIIGINNLYEKECGQKSGWLYMVNGKTPGKGASQYTLSNDDIVEFFYTVN